MKRNKAFVSSMADKFSPYIIKDVITVQYIVNELVITYMDNENRLQTATFNSSDVIVRIG